MNNKLYHECYEHVCQARSLLEDLRSFGFDILERTSASPDGYLTAGSQGGAQVPAPLQTLDGLKTEAEQCRRCPLAATRTKVVFGRGNPLAEVVFVGEAPGFEEDRQGLPFVGEAGRLLERIIFSMGLSVKDVYICNLIKCRPPGNRNPAAEEVTACRPYLERQLTLLEPQVIVTLGRFAAQSLLEVQTPVSRLRGNWYQYQGIAVMPTFHPAYLLRSPAEKKRVWEDMKKVKRHLTQKK
ncbi:MAG: uracil-DNA glycosylase [Pelovirga sp.]